jgi:hypothetical protein
MQRFWSKAEIAGSGCILWVAAKNSNGYGRFRLGDKVIDSHRVAFMLTYGEIPKGMLVCHTCDVRLCVNPEHLWLGTYSDNLVDALQKGRKFIPLERSFGEKHHASKLTTEQVLEIRRRHKETGIGWRRLSREYGLNGKTITHVLNRDTWKHI